MMTYILILIAVVLVVVWGLSPRQQVISPGGDRRKITPEEIKTATGRKRLGLFVLALTLGLVALGFFLAGIAELYDSKPTTVRSFDQKSKSPESLDDHRHDFDR
jgi:hypothetical protein